LFAHVTTFCDALPEHVEICRITSSFVPTIPTGSRMPPCSSRMNSCGSRCSTSRSGGSSMDRARSIAVRTSSFVISFMRLPMLMPPCEFSPRICGPPIPTTAVSIGALADLSAITAAASTAAAAGRRSAITPRRIPRAISTPWPL